MKLVKALQLCALVLSLSAPAFAGTVQMTVSGFQSVPAKTADEAAALVSIDNSTSPAKYTVHIGHKNMWGYTPGEILNIEDGFVVDSVKTNPNSEATLLTIKVQSKSDPSKTVAISYYSAYADTFSYSLSSTVSGTDYKFTMSPRVSFNLAP